MADPTATGKPAAHMVNPIFLQKAAILSAQQGGRGDYYRRLQVKKRVTGTLVAQALIN